ncbi:MAG TPA: hypothetical protein VGS58_18485, partial [Candidatus Sulfopaludibacter sp.]|nr:hypothetical protein [Candidatus Sulfopaludibacter sp.]
FDDGDHWQSLQLNMPAVSVRDLVVHDDDLVVATHGRSLWILDDVSALRQVSAKAADSDAWLFKPATAIRMNPESFLGTPFPLESPQAENPPDGAILDYYLKSAAPGEVTLEILNSKNEVVRRFSSNDRPAPSRRRVAIADYWFTPPQSLGTRAGMSRFVWDLRYAPASAEADGGEGGPPGRGPQVLPGVYQVRLTVASRASTEPLKVALDPRSSATPADLAKQFDLALKAWRDVKTAAGTMRQVTALRRRIAEIQSQQAANAAVVSLASEVDTSAAQILGGSGGRGAAGAPSGLAAVESELNAALGVAESADRTPPAAAYTLYEQGSRRLAQQLAAWQTLKNGKLAEFNRALRAGNLPEIDLAAAAQ